LASLERLNEIAEWMMRRLDELLMPAWLRNWGDRATATAR
jgi:hypothetical protein